MNSEIIVDLKLRYGQHEYNYPHLSAKNIKSVIVNHGCTTYEAVNHWCSRLDRIVAEINAMKERLHG